MADLLGMDRWAVSWQHWASCEAACRVVAELHCSLLTLRYVHHVEEHHRPIPDEILAARAGLVDPDECVIAMLGARSTRLRGNGVATEPRSLSSI